MLDILIAVLAAGSSSRLGQPKQLVTIKGEALLHRQCRMALETQIAPVAVVLGSNAMACAKAIAELPVTQLINQNWKEGIASSVRVATQAAIQLNASGLLILLCDQFKVTAQDLQKLCRAWAKSGGTKACRSRYQDYAGPPVILPKACFPMAMELHGDEGARKVFEKLKADSLIEVPMLNAVQDLDLPSQLQLEGAC